jgi:pseudouridine-5'-phosphate glycosidase
MHPIDGDLLRIGEEVRDALAAGRPVVALESTIITHGMPRPTNLQTARTIETVVRENGATPATIAILNGAVRVGLTPEELEQVGSAQDAAKASRRDIAPAALKRLTAGTTVAATIFLAARAGICVAATGGIGGVHRGGAASFDISADLRELATTPVAVVCAGCKSILDIAKTLEFLETEGVPVLGFRTDMFPAFYARSSGRRLDHRFETPRDLAAVIRSGWRMGQKTGVVVANPIPEADALSSAEIEGRIAAACQDAEREGVSQQALTPYLLARMNELTGGRSLAANIALVKNNAALAARLAVELSRISSEH